VPRVAVSGRVPMAGRVVGMQSQNLLVRSEQLADSVWVEYGGAIVLADEAPPPFVGGGGLADTFQDPVEGSPNFHGLYQLRTNVLGQIYTLSAYLKTILLANSCALLLGNAQTSFSTFDLVTGTVAMAAGGSNPPLSRSIVSAGGGWWRCSITVAQVIPGPVDWDIASAVSGGGGYIYQGAGARRFYMWGAQLNSSGAALPYQPTTGAPVGSDVELRAPVSGRVPA